MGEGTACDPDVLVVELAASSVRAYIPAMDLKFWQKALREAERELAATTRTALDAAKKFMPASLS